MSAKLLFLDVDGTLTEPGYNVPPDSAVEAIRRAQANGHKVFICSGRNPAMLASVLKYGFDGYVACAGGHVVCEGEVINDVPMDEELFRLAMDCFGRNYVYRTVECLNGSYCDDGPDDLPRGAEAYTNDTMLRYRRRLKESLGMRHISEYDGAPVYKIVFMCTDHSQLEEPKRLLSDRFVVCVQDLESERCINGEVADKRINKGIGIQKICERLGFDTADTIGFGDGVNDKGMFRAVGLSVCMANGHPDMKEMADMICPSVSDDGLYKAFEQLGLI